MDKEAKALRKKWRVLTKDYQIYSLEHNWEYYPYRYVVDRKEEFDGNSLTKSRNDGIINTNEISIEVDIATL